jgi:hypothetical protein
MANTGDSSGKRKVYVTITYFPGTGSHFHVEMREESDTQREGEVRFMKFNRDDTARRWVDHTFSEEFSEETHELVFRGDVNDTWFYPEGD